MLGNRGFTDKTHCLRAAVIAKYFPLSLTPLTHPPPSFFNRKIRHSQTQTGVYISTSFNYFVPSCALKLTLNYFLLFRIIADLCEQLNLIILLD